MLKLFVICLLIAGCASLPDTIGECETEECERKVIALEDARARRAATAERKRNCTFGRGLVWDARTEQCRSCRMLDWC